MVALKSLVSKISKAKVAIDIRKSPPYVLGAAFKFSPVIGSFTNWYPASNLYLRLVSKRHLSKKVDASRRGWRSLCTLL